MPETQPKDTVSISGEVRKDLFDALLDLARKRGVSANTVLQQAILNEKYLSDQIAEGNSILVQKPDKSINKLNLAK